MDAADGEKLVQEARRARQLGFRGKLLSHPSQIEPVHRVFSPSEHGVGYARRVVAAFRQAEAQGLGAISLEGKMIDVAFVRQAEEVRSRDEAITARNTQGKFPTA
jgi:citrate lyase subunit beta/citryl-CoA lyase